MSALVRYERPSWSLSNLLDDFLGDGFFSANDRMIPATSWPKVDIVENDGNYAIKADLPGLDKKDIKVEVEDGVLTISGEKREEKRDRKKGNYYRFERSYGSFTRSFSLPDHVDASSIDAHYTNGVLELTLTKTEKARPKAIDVKVG